MYGGGIEMVYMVGHGYKVVYTVNGTSYEVFGAGTRITTLAARNNLERIYVLGQRNPASIVPLRWEGAWGIETNPVSLEPLSDFGLGSGTNLVTGIIAITDTSNNVVRKLVDAVVQRATLSARQGELVRMTLDGIYKRDDYPTVTETISSSESESDNTPLTFADGTLTISGITNGVIQGFEITINMNANPVYGLGSRFFKGVVLQAFEAEGRATVVMDASEYASFLQAHSLQDNEDSLTELTTVTLDFGGSSITLNNVLVNELTHSIEPNELVILDVIMYAKDVSITPGTTG